MSNSPVVPPNTSLMLPPYDELVPPTQVQYCPNRGVAAVWFVREGRGRFWVADAMTEAGPGSVLWGPRGVPHAFSADTAELKVVVITLPAGLESFFVAVGEPAGFDGPPPSSWAPPVEDEATVAARFGIELLGPQPGWTPSRD